MFRGLSSIIYKEVFHIVRDPMTLLLMAVVPGFDMMMFGYAIDLDVRNIDTVVYNLDQRPESRRVLDAFWNTGYFQYAGEAHSDDQVVREIVRGNARIGIKIPPNYSDAIVSGETARLQVLIDGSDSVVAMQSLNIVNAIALRESMDIMSDFVASPDELPVEARPRILFNPNMRTPNFMIPALVAITMQMLTTLLTCFAVVREKERGTLEQLMVTPVSRLGLMLGKLLPYAVISAFENVFVIGIMAVWFEIPVHGSMALLLALSAPFLFCNLGVGLLISNLAANQMQAVQLAFFFILPAVLLSGFMFPRETMPGPIYAAGQLIPATYYIEILRGIVLRGASFADLWTQTLILTLEGIVLVAIAASRFHKTLD